MKTIVILGAARSGTKILRNTLSSSVNCIGIPYDINFVWRQGRNANENDELNVLSEDSVILENIRASISKAAMRGETGVQDNPGFIVEKTVSNTLRVPFVRQCLPEASFVHIIRNGTDAVSSALQQWQSRPDWKYLLNKLSYFPKSDFKYALWFLKNQFFRDADSISIWGPRYEGIEEDASHLPLHIVCARQWAKCLTKTIDSLEEMESEGTNVNLSLGYEAFCQSKQEVISLCQTLGVDSHGPSLYWEKHVSRDSIGLGGSKLDAQLIREIHMEFDKYPKLKSFY